jgi:hypothetical protein
MLVDGRLQGKPATSPIVPERDLRNYRENPWIPDDVAWK